MGRAAEIAREQAYVSRLYGRLDALREQARLRLAEVLRHAGTGTPQARNERDVFALMYEDRLAQLDAVEPGLCFGRLDMETGERLYVGRIGLTDERQDTLLVDWRAPAAEPFYRATPAAPAGVVRRRHLRTRAREVLDVEDDVFAVERLTAADQATLGGGGALLAALVDARTGRMRDIVATIQAEQDQAIRSEPAGVLVIQGGPGTGKTAVALHRAAYLLYTQRERLAKAGVLVVGPGPTFLQYIEQVLPSLGETGVVMATLDGLLPNVRVAGVDPVEVARLKADLRMADLVAAAVAARQRVPDQPMVIRYGAHSLVLTPSDLANARGRARRTLRRHNRARYAFAKQVLRLAVGRLAEVDAELAADAGAARDIMTSDDFRDVVDACWPRLSAATLIAELFTAERLAEAAAGLLSAAEQALLARPVDDPWTAADVPIVDEAWALLGDPDEVLRRAAERRRQQAERLFARQAAETTPGLGWIDPAVLAERFAGPRNAGRPVAERAASDPDWQFGHVVVDEAQELSPMAWRMLVRRCPMRSMTVVGDLAQASAPWGAAPWSQQLDRVAPDRWRLAELRINYRTPREVMDVAADVLAAVDPTATAPTSVRDAGVPPRAHRVIDAPLGEVVARVVGEARLALPDGKLAVISPEEHYDEIVAQLDKRFAGLVGTGSAGLDAVIAVLRLPEAKGLEFDGVVVVEPVAFTSRGNSGLRDLYVALTRPTQRLDVVQTGELPAVLRRLAQTSA